MLQFWSESTTVYSSRRKQQVFKANRGAEILYTTDVSLWNHISGINNPADIGTRGINIECMLERVIVVFASDEGKIRPSVIITKAEEWKSAIQWN